MALLNGSCERSAAVRCPVIMGVPFREVEALHMAHEPKTHLQTSFPTKAANREDFDGRSDSEPLILVPNEVGESNYQMELETAFVALTNGATLAYKQAVLEILILLPWLDKERQGSAQSMPYANSAELADTRSVRDQIDTLLDALMMQRDLQTQPPPDPVLNHNLSIASTLVEDECRVATVRDGEQHNDLKNLNDALKRDVTALEAMLEKALAEKDRAWAEVDALTNAFEGWHERGLMATNGLQRLCARCCVKLDDEQHEEHQARASSRAGAHAEDARGEEVCLTLAAVEHDQCDTEGCVATAPLENTQHDAEGGSLGTPTSRLIELPKELDALETSLTGSAEHVVCSSEATVLRRSGVARLSAAPAWSTSRLDTSGLHLEDSSPRHSQPRHQSSEDSLPPFLRTTSSSRAQQKPAVTPASTPRNPRTKRLSGVEAASSSATRSGRPRSANNRIGSRSRSNSPEQSDLRSDSRGAHVCAKPSRLRCRPPDDDIITQDIATQVEALLAKATSMTPTCSKTTNANASSSTRVARTSSSSRNRSSTPQQSKHLKYGLFVKKPSATSIRGSELGVWR